MAVRQIGDFDHALPNHRDGMTGRQERDAQQAMTSEELNSTAHHASRRGIAKANLGDWCTGTPVPEPQTRPITFPALADICNRREPWLDDRGGCEHPDTAHLHNRCCRLNCPVWAGLAQTRV